MYDLPIFNLVLVIVLVSSLLCVSFGLILFCINFLRSCLCNGIEVDTVSFYSVHTV